MLTRTLPAILFALACACLLVILYLPESPRQSSIVGQPFPLLPAATFHGEAPPSGQPVLYNLFATWCTPCIAELPELQTLHNQTGITLVGIAWNDKADKLTPWLAKHRAPFHTVYLDQQGAIGAALGVGGLPETYLVDAQGRITYHHAGVITSADIAAIRQQIHAITP